jgi:hypothetical protein
LKPENVETLPVGKKFDQFGPVQFNRAGKIREVLIRMVNTGAYFCFLVYEQDVATLGGQVDTEVNMEKTYSINFPKGINPNIFRMEIFAEDVFHRFDAKVRVNIDGAQTENKWMQIK